MSILIIGGDKTGKLEALLRSLGATRTEHWDGRRNSDCRREIPSHTDGIIMLTDFLNHNAMNRFKRTAKKQKIPFVCGGRGTAQIACEFSKLAGMCRGECGRKTTKTGE
jgi:hypothetical protein